MNAKLSALLIALSATTTTFAQTPWFITAGAGQSNYADACGDAAFPSCDDQDTAYRVGVGYQIEPNYRVELSYFDFGDASAASTVDSIMANTTTTALQMSVLYPVAPKFAVYGKFGAAFNRSELTYEFDNGAGTRFVSEGKDSNTSLINTLGVSMQVMPQLGIHAQVDYLPNGLSYKDLNPNNTLETARSDITVWGLGLEYAF